MNSNAKTCAPRGWPDEKCGFALVVTVSLMVLLAILAVGLLSLSAVSLRASALETAQSQARANARLALMLAIGELQKHAGIDTRVTAPSDIVDQNSPSITGVWRSWEGGDHETSGRFAGRPVTPSYDSKKKPDTSGGRFLTWLVSGFEAGTAPENPTKLAHGSPAANSIPLLSVGTLAPGDKRQVHMIPQPLASGSFAWWASGENQKARLPHPYQPEDKASAAGWSVIAKSHAVADTKPFELDTLLENPSPAARAITLNTADIIAKKDAKTTPRGFFLDLSASSTGLLTNTATGGWRKDLSLLTESWERQPTSRLALFQINPTTATQAPRPAPGNAVPPGSMLYPWATYRSPDHIPIYQHGPVTSWANLVDWATHYKRAGVSAGGQIRSPIHSVAIDTRSENHEFLHKVRVLPLIARMQWVFSHSAAQPPNSREQYEPRLLLTPAITMWNPYNVEITSPARLDFIIPKAMPAALKYTFNGRENPNYNAVMAGVTNQPSLGGGTLRFSIDAPFTLMPGETRLFSPSSKTPAADNATVALQPGYRSGGGHYFPVKDTGGQKMLLPGSATLKAEAKFDTVEEDRAQGVGIYLDMIVPRNGESRRHLVYRMIYTPEVAGIVYPPLRNLAEGTLSQCATNPQPFLSTIFGARTASNTHLAAKGFVQSSPLVNYTAMGRKDEVEDTIRRHYAGTAHPVNSPFDYSFVKHAPGGDSQLPNASDNTGRGYIITGFNKADGLSRCVIAELPVRPLASLGELVNWDLRYENPIPPYAINLIGNSDASPLLPPNAVYNPRDASLSENLQYDDSYCANHLLFDDWFVSSIAPDPATFGSSGRSQKETHAAFLTGTTPLANRAYRPIREDRVASRQETNTIYQKHVEPLNAWRTIASRIEVDGMFNVNSTSVTAWRALLGHARDQRVPHIRESGGRWSIGLSDAADHVWSRFSIAGDTEAGTPGSSGAFPEATEFAGYRTVDDEFLDSLAREVVEQIRRRGPFLSLSEFVNRQLSSGDLALAGTIQAALNKLAENNSNDPFKAIKALSTVATKDPPSPARATYDEEYGFRDAGSGHSAYGMPGWTRQADILRPLAPILSARDDTFTIRGYGDARDPNGNILARAWCEASVRRTRDFVDLSDAADLTTAPTRPANRSFGRRYEIMSFRWLSADEV
jgi:type II secretory pathway pseudopilin PulG